MKCNYLPGGVLIAIRGKAASLIQNENAHHSKLRSFIIVKLKKDSKIIALISLCRIPSSSPRGSSCCVAQHNAKEEKAESPNKHRKSIFKQIKQYLEDNSNVNNIIVAGDFNQDISSLEMRKFFSEIRVENTHHHQNNIPLDEIDETQTNGSTPIDSITVSEGIMECIEGAKLINHNDIFFSNHRACIIDFNVEEHFNVQLSYYDEINHAQLNPSRRSH